MCPLVTSARVITPAIIEIELAVTFQLKLECPAAVVAVGSVHESEEAIPRSTRTSVVAPPHLAVQAPVLDFAARQNSHSRMLPSGCTWATARFLSPQLAGLAVAGIGTEDHARMSAGSW